MSFHYIPRWYDCLSYILSEKASLDERPIENCYNESEAEVTSDELRERKINCDAILKWKMILREKIY